MDTIETYNESMQNLRALRVECAMESNDAGWQLLNRIQRRLTQRMNSLLAE